jgi:malate permease and related proteins
MNDSSLTLSILFSIAEISGLMLIGGIGRYLRYIDERDIDRWSKMTLDFLFPMFIFSSIIAGFKPERLGELWALPFIGFGIAAGGFLFGLVLKYGLVSKDKDIIRTFLFGCAVNNFGYLPIVIVSNMYDKNMLANLFFLTLGSTIVNWTLGVGVLGSGQIKTTIRNLFSPNLLAIVVGILVSIAGIDRYIPPMVGKIFVSAGSAAVPLMLILSGATLFKLSALRINWQVAYFTIVRLVILPSLTIAGLKLLPLPQDLFALSVIIALMPLAVSQSIFTRIFGGHPEFAASSSLVSTVASIVTIPFALWLLFG